MTEWEDMQRAMADAISSAVADVERGVVLRWVLIVETIGPDGDRGLWRLASPENHAWETIGMLTDALNREQAKAFTDRLGDGTA